MMQLSQQPSKYHLLISSITYPMAVAQALLSGAGVFLLCHGPACWGDQVVGWLWLEQGSQAEDE